MEELLVLSIPFHKNFKHLKFFKKASEDHSEGLASLNPLVQALGPMEVQGYSLVPVLLSLSQSSQALPGLPPMGPGAARVLELITLLL